MTSSALIEPTPFGGWPHNLRLSNGQVELVITLDVGPRIIRYAPVGGRNVLGEMTDDLGRSNEDTWKLRGGHRLWTSPEDPVRTYQLDNGPVEHHIEAGRVRVTTRPDIAIPIQKTMVVELAARGSQVTIVHRLKNLGEIPFEVAVWALTVMAPGGVAVVPLAPTGQHPGDRAKTAADFAPRVTMSLWPYFQFGDPRITFGRKYLKERQDRTMSSTKLGLCHRRGWVSYWTEGALFSKRIPHEEGAAYPDGGVNFECYTDPDILELESLGPLTTLRPGAETAHVEQWSLATGVPAPDDESQIDRAWAAAGLT